MSPKPSLAAPGSMHPSASMCRMFISVTASMRIRRSRPPVGEQRFRAGKRSRSRRGVSFEVRAGEVLGLIGSNGSGKSSLIRAIAGLQSLASGQIDVRGRAAMLGVGAVLKPRLSGLRNVMLGGLAMGLSREEIEAELENVAEFSGVGDAIRRPMSTYSSGMRARLAFAIATMRVPEILLIDEALAVGDKEFRARSFERVQQVREQAGTVVLVSHSLREIASSCTHAVWLEQGRLRMTGPPGEVVAAYEQLG